MVVKEIKLNRKGDLHVNEREEDRCVKKAGFEKRT